MADKETLDLPLGVISAIEGRRAVLFLGAGASMECKNPDNEKPLDGNGLRDAICDYFLGGEYKGYDLTSAAEFAIEQHGKPNVFEFIASSFKTFQPSKAHELISEFGWRAIATTNYDTFVEAAYQKNADRRVQNLVRFVKDSEPIQARLQNEDSPVQYLKLHGCLDHLHDDGIPLVLSHESYERYSTNRIRLFSRLEDWAYESTYIFCGYKLADAHIRALVSKLSPAKDVRPTFYLISPGVSPLEKQHWEQNRVTVIDATFGQFMESLIDQIPEIKRRISFGNGFADEPITKFFKSNIQPPRLVSEFLEKDVIFVSPDMISEQQNPVDFYKGLDTGFGCIQQNLTVARGVVDDLLYQVLEDDSSHENANLIVLKGPAGNGKSIALKQAAWEIATTLNRLVLFLTDGGSLDWDAIEQINDLTGQRIFLAVDRSALYVDEIDKVLSKAKSLGVQVTVLTAETDSEWFNYCSKLEKHANTELRVRYLSQREIIALIEKLDRYDCLGVIKDLSQVEQIKRFEDNAERQLLVALHEVTQGKRFEEIILNEYQRIIPSEAQSLYLDICTMGQFGVGARAGTVQRISGIQFKHYETEFFKPLENIINTRKDPYTGDLMYMPRHARVANFVFRGVCDTDKKKASQLLKILNELDVGYSSDKTVFDRLTKGHALVRNMSDPVAVRSIYSAAIEAAPEAFVYQQWAIFESTHPDGCDDTARQVIEEARTISPHNQAIIHTQSEVFRKSARNAKSEIAKKRFRDECRRYLSKLRDDNSRFKIATQVKLLTDELDDLLSSNNALEDNAFADKLLAVEIVLSKGKQLYPDFAEFHQCEARLQEILDDPLKTNQALEKAIKSGARGDTIWVRLAKGYYLQGDATKERSTLDAALEHFPDSKVVHLSLAKHLMNEDSIDWEKVERHLARSYDTVDRNFEARFTHAQVLFKLNKVPESLKLFEWLNDNAPNSFRPFPANHLNEIEATIPQQSGGVTSKTESFLFVTSGHVLSGLYANESQTDEAIWDQIRSGMQVTYRLQFCRRGPQAVSLKL